jgi:hypothetical protein
MCTGVIPGASHLVHTDRPAEFVVAVHDISANHHVPPNFRLVEEHRDEG